MNRRKPTLPATGLLRGADLAGACEGEQIADLIDLAIAVATAGNSSRNQGLLSLRAERLITEIRRRAQEGR